MNIEYILQQINKMRSDLSMGDIAGVDKSLHSLQMWMEEEQFLQDQKKQGNNQVIDEFINRMKEELQDGNRVLGSVDSTTYVKVKQDVLWLRFIIDELEKLKKDLR